MGVEDLAAVAVGFGVVVQAVEAFVVRHEGNPEGVVEGVFRFAFGVNARQAHLRPVVAVVGFAEFAPFLLFAVDFVQRQPARFTRRDAVVDLSVKGAIDVCQGFRQADAMFTFKVFQVGFGCARVERAAEAAGGEGFEVLFEFFGNVHRVVWVLVFAGHCIAIAGGIRY